MTVGNLIAELAYMPEDLEVFIGGVDKMPWEATLTWRVTYHKRKQVKKFLKQTFSAKETKEMLSSNPKEWICIS